MWYNRLGRLKQVNDAVGLNRTFAYDAAFQLANETMTGLIARTITRSYESAQAGAKGRRTGIEVGTAADPDADHKSEYFYDVYGRLERVTGPGLPAYGAVYSRASNSELLASHTFNTDASTVVGEEISNYEDDRDLIASIENKWGATQVSNVYSHQRQPRPPDVGGARGHTVGGAESRGMLNSEASWGRLQARDGARTPTRTCDAPAPNPRPPRREPATAH